MKYFVLIFTVWISLVPAAFSSDFNQDKFASIIGSVEISQPDEHGQDLVSETAIENGEAVDESEHHASLDPLFFIILALIIGAATRHFLQKSPIPFTVMLLIFGLVLGLSVRFGLLDIWNFGFAELNVSIIGRSISWAAHIDPHILLYTFLPVLIFEAAFALDVHTFKKTFTNATLLAVPGIVIALLLTGAIMMGMKAMGMGLELWSWEVALMFGSVISATDPVAVVALLKELGASKKLGTLIEGESMLNDGTAIVLFMVFFLPLTGEISGDSPTVSFFRVSIGGVIVGGLVGYLVLRWLKKVFNDAMVEISIIVSAAYLTFFLAENIFHVSGVLAVMTLGVIMASTGRTRISPEVEHFMHEFWELAGFIANSLLFIIVGVVIAQRSEFSLNDFIIMLCIYVGIHVVRALMILMLYPAMSRIGYGITFKESCIAWYGGLRGAIALALALIVSGVDDKYIPQEIRDQFLFYIAGIVTLTLMINATTIKFLVARLGMTKLSPEKIVMINEAMEYLRHSTERSLEKIKTNRFTSKANYDKVSEYLPDTSEKYPDVQISTDTSLFEIRRRILEKEKSAYWNLFKEGMLESASVQRLADGISEIMDSAGMKSLSDRPDLEEEWKTPALLTRVQSWTILRRITQRFFFEKLALSYDTAMGFVLAQEETLKLLESMNLSANTADMKKQLEKIENEINENRIHGLTFLRNVRNSYPEIFTAISTRQAIRTMLNAERHTVDRLVGRGRINSEEANKLYKSIDVRLKKLIDSPPAFEIPKSILLLRNTPWMKDLDDSRFNKIADLFQDRNFAADQVLIKKDGKDEGLFVIIRGNVNVMLGEKVIDRLGAGDITGELAILADNPRSATVIAESPVTAQWISAVNIKKAMGISGELETRLWEFAGPRFVENKLRNTAPYNTWSLDKLKSWIQSGKIVNLKEGSVIELKNEVYMLLSGLVMKSGEKEKTLKAPAILENGDVIASASSRVFIRKEDNT